VRLTRFGSVPAQSKLQHIDLGETSAHWARMYIWFQSSDGTERIPGTQSRFRYMRAKRPGDSPTRCEGATTKNVTFAEIGSVGIQNNGSSPVISGIVPKGNILQLNAPKTRNIADPKDARTTKQLCGCQPNFPGKLRASLSA